jgi:hypothetical protein
MFVPEHRLWSAVILNTVQEWLSGPLGLSQPAEQYLFHDEKDFPLVCECAGMNPGRLRSRLVRMRRQQKDVTLLCMSEVPPTAASAAHSQERFRWSARES